MLGFVNVRGTFEGNECSVLIGPMNYKPLVPWKPEGASEKLKEDGVKVLGGPRRWGWGHGCSAPGTGDVDGGPVQGKVG